MIARRAFLAGITALWAAPALAQQAPFAAGQVWALSDPNLPNARVRVGRVEGDTVHISLWGAPTPANLTPVMGPTLVMAHLPITATALRASVAQQVSDAPPDGVDFEGGYQTWRDAQGGVFTLTVPDIITQVVSSMGPRPSGK